MRTNEPRLTPLADSDLNDTQEAMIAPFRGGGRDYNIFRTFVRHPAALKAFLGWGGYILSEHNSLDARLREIAILRTGYRCRAGYEFARHVPIGKRAGLSDQEIDALKQDADAGEWTDAERAVIRAADELVADQFVSDATWAALTGALSEHQAMDFVFTVGQYTMVSMFLNSAGVQLDSDVTLDPQLDARV
jgi:4-carboxymuconolactone decarboxylase